MVSLALGHVHVCAPATATATAACWSTSLPTVAGPEKCIALKLVQQTRLWGSNVLGHRLPGVSAPSEWGARQIEVKPTRAAHKPHNSNRAHSESWNPAKTSTKKKQQDKSPKTNHNQGYRNRGENYLGGRENHTGYKRGEFETCHGAPGRTAKWKTENRKSSGSRSAMSCCFHYCLFSLKKKPTKTPTKRFPWWSLLQ